MISIKEVLEIHDILIQSFGGSPGIRDVAGLDSALTRPFQTFDGKELYHAPVNKAAALLESLLINHPFIDGNKRTPYVVMRSFLIAHHIDISASQDEKYIFIINIAAGMSNQEAITAWLFSHSRHL
jgi:death-on-curing protein